MKNVFILFILALFFSSLSAQTKLSPTSIRKGQIAFSVAFPLKGDASFYESAYLFSANYTHFIGQHGISFGMFSKRRISVLNAGRNEILPIGFEAGYKYAFRKQISRKWQPYAFYNATFYHKYKSSALNYDLYYINYNIYTNIVGVGMTQRLYKHLNFDIAGSINYAIWDYYKYPLHKGNFAPHLKMGFIYQFWK